MLPSTEAAVRSCDRMASGTTGSGAGAHGEGRGGAAGLRGGRRRRGDAAPLPGSCRLGRAASRSAPVCSPASARCFAACCVRYVQRYKQCVSSCSVCSSSLHPWCCWLILTVSVRGQHTCHHRCRDAGAAVRAAAGRAGRPAALRAVPFCQPGWRCRGSAAGFACSGRAAVSGVLAPELVLEQCSGGWNGP